MLETEYDESKNAKNLKYRGLSFELVNNLDWQTALIWQDDREDYGEVRFSVLGLIDKRLYSVVFTHREEKLRVISLRKANKREQRKYSNAKK